MAPTNQPYKMPPVVLSILEGIGKKTSSAREDTIAKPGRNAEELWPFTRRIARFSVMSPNRMNGNKIATKKIGRASCRERGKHEEIAEGIIRKRENVED